MCHASLSVCLFICLLNYSESYEQILEGIERGQTTIVDQILVANLLADGRAVPDFYALAPIWGLLLFPVFPYLSHFSALIFPAFHMHLSFSFHVRLFRRAVWLSGI